MQTVERKNILSNINKLIECTSVNLALLSPLVVKKIISVEDGQHLVSISSKLEAARELYEIIQKRKEGYEVLVGALKATKQSKAYNILKQILPDGQDSVDLNQGYQEANAVERDEFRGFPINYKRKYSYASGLQDPFLCNPRPSTERDRLVSSYKPPSSLISMKKLFLTILLIMIFVFLIIGMFSFSLLPKTTTIITNSRINVNINLLKDNVHKPLQQNLIYS